MQDICEGCAIYTNYYKCRIKTNYYKCRIKTNGHSQECPCAKCIVKIMCMKSCDDYFTILKKYTAS